MRTNTAIKSLAFKRAKQQHGSRKWGYHTANRADWFEERIVRELPEVKHFPVYGLADRTKAVAYRGNAVPVIDRRRRPVAR